MTKAKNIKSRRDHGNSTFDYGKWNEIIELTKRDVTQKSACAYVGLPVSTFHDWIKRDEELSEQYEAAQQYMDVITSNAITYAIMDKDIPSTDRAKYALEWKKRRDDRYKDKKELSGSLNTLDLTESTMIDEEYDLDDE